MIPWEFGGEFIRATSAGGVMGVKDKEELSLVPCSNQLQFTIQIKKDTCFSIAQLVSFVSVCGVLNVVSTSMYFIDSILCVYVCTCVRS